MERKQQKCQVSALYLELQCYVVSPNGGENWARGTTGTISWTSVGSAEPYVKIELLKAGMLDSVLILHQMMVPIISWSSVGSPGDYIRIELLKGGILDSTVTSSTYNDGSFDWGILSTQTLGNDYKIRVTSTSNLAYTDTSNTNFTISSGISPPSITVISPNGGENWARGTTKLITWTKTGNPGACQS